jgi:hypothetical protein
MSRTTVRASPTKLSGSVLFLERVAPITGTGWTPRCTPDRIPSTRSDELGVLTPNRKPPENRESSPDRQAR